LSSSGRPSLPCVSTATSVLLPLSMLPATAGAGCWCSRTHSSDVKRTQTRVEHGAGCHTHLTPVHRLANTDDKCTMTEKVTTCACE
jgi:hypothetical protein